MSDDDVGLSALKLSPFLMNQSKIATFSDLKIRPCFPSPGLDVTDINITKTLTLTQLMHPVACCLQPLEAPRYIILLKRCCE